MVLNSEILNLAYKDNEGSIQITDNPYVIKSIPNVFPANYNDVLITPTTGKRLDIKGITIQTNDTGAIIKLKRGNGVPIGTQSNTDVLLSVYASNFERGGTSSSLNILLDKDETLNLEITNATKETFVGVSYREIER